MFFTTNPFYVNLTIINKPKLQLSSFSNIKNINIHLIYNYGLSLFFAKKNLIKFCSYISNCFFFLKFPNMESKYCKITKLSENLLKADCHSIKTLKYLKGLIEKPGDVSHFRKKNGLF